MAAMASGDRGTPRPFGSRPGPGEALAAVASSLERWYRPVAAEKPATLRLEAGSTDLPDLLLRLAPDRRLFSRTLALAVAAEELGIGPDHDLQLRLTPIRPLRHRRRLVAEGGGAVEGGQVFEDAGLLRGVQRMTNVRELRLGWSADERRWRLGLTTLAGALIGTSPMTSVAVPLEPEDVEGLVEIARAFRAGAKG
jgi:hypothetical protein